MIRSQKKSIFDPKTGNGTKVQVVLSEFFDLVVNRAFFYLPFPLRLTLALFLLISLDLANSATLNCTFLSDGWDFAVPNAYICRASKVNFTTKVDITKVEGEHKNFLVNDHVLAIHIVDQICEYFPSGLEKFFQNIQGIAVQKSQLKVIRKADLKPFPKLISLSLYGNQLTTIEYGLFMYNPNLQMLSIFDNKIYAISEDLLDGLSDLKQVHFQGNICIGMFGKSDEEIKKVKDKIAQSCQATEDMKELREMEKNVDELNWKFEICDAELQGVMTVTGEFFMLYFRNFDSKIMVSKI